MHKCFKYLGSLNLISLADQLMGNVLATGDKSTAEVDRDFFQIYKWTSLPAGFHEARKTGKPIFVFIQRSTCPACKHLKSKFVKSLKLSELSSRFVMVNVDNGPDSVRNRGVFHPDGKYVPRILFFTPEGRLLREAYNRHARDPKYKYFYSNPSHVIETMLMVLQILGAFPPNVDQPPDIANQSGTPSKTPAEDDFHTPTVLDQ
ncbi:thioredoxin domain-containing protein 12-like [Orussus abietinus]|uniref:thioredoxin domain-containing protein 12-like n=1 Tax=Orussus abietinus TaxID=222816 RepID=UPI000626589F|nr:thioredoxin domain-containing protein 12-like [Orussus abietinus]